ncbi:MAG: 3-methyl-2-oxobutanoate hydroxymethyltransferase [Thermoproteota archaeon]|nr:3-methyl-2-oxobutanoate hydroxymethyltransferase [Thermoproteota archaeon]
MSSNNKDNSDKVPILRKLTVNDILRKKKEGHRIAMITAYDYCMSRICDCSNIDIILVGDSAATVMVGYQNTRKITMEEMLLFCKAVSNGTKRALIVGDMPFGSYQTGLENAVINAVKFIRSGCDAVKLEGGVEIVHIVKRLSEIGIPVMGHIGLKPQTTSLTRGFDSHGATTEEAVKLIEEAKALGEAGVFAIVLEKVTSEVAEIIASGSQIPIIGIGSGPMIDGQVLVLHDLLGLYKEIKPRFVKRYLDLSKLINVAITEYSHEVRSGIFPNEEHTYHMQSGEIEKLRRIMGLHQN